MSRRSFPRIDPAALRDHADDERVDRVWDRIEHDLNGPVDRPRAEASRGRSGARATIAYALVAAMIGAFGAGMLVGKVTTEKPPLDAQIATPKLDTNQVEVLAAGTHQRSFPLAGGGRITLEPSATVEVEHTGGAIVVLLVQGGTLVDSSARNVAIVAGEARVEAAVGSVLSVRRNADDLDVSVSEGTASITSPAGSRQLGKDDRADGVPIHASVAIEPAPHTAPRRGPVQRPRRPTNAHVPLPKGTSQPEWFTHYPADDAAALALLLKQGVNQAIDTGSAAELMAIAEIMSGKGRDQVAEVRALVRLVQGFPKDQRASLAADRLAKIYEARGDATQAKQYRDQVQPLAENATTGSDSLICDLIRREPDKTKAALGAKEYLDKYPNGECREEFERLVQSSAPTTPTPAAVDSASPPAP